MQLLHCINKSNQHGAEPDVMSGFAIMFCSMHLSAFYLASFFIFRRQPEKLRFKLECHLCIIWQLILCFFQFNKMSLEMADWCNSMIIDDHIIWRWIIFIMLIFVELSSQLMNLSYIHWFINLFIGLVMGINLFFGGHIIDITSFDFYFWAEQGYSVVLPEKLQTGKWNVYRYTSSNVLGIGCNTSI